MAALPIADRPAARESSRPSSAHRAANGWLAIVVLLSLPAAVPLLVILASTLSPDVETWSHLSRYVLPRVLGNTLVLVVGVASLTAVLGVGLAWLTAGCDFPGRRCFDWALLLPLAVPGYVLSTVAVGFLDYAGPLQTALRGWFGDGVWLPPIRSTGGVIVVMSLALYPYVYLLARSAFLTQGTRLLEAARTLGHGPGRAFWYVALPVARPWIVAGVALVAMETLADFGTVAVFNYDTFTTAIYRAWFGLFSVSAALELAAVLMLIVAVALAVERRARSGAGFSVEAPTRAPIRVVLGPRARWVAALCAAAVLLLGFGLPFVQLLVWAARHAATDLDSRYLGFVGRSVTLAGLAALIVLAAAVLLAYGTRIDPRGITRAFARVATLGYAVPGTVLAVGIIVPVALASRTLGAWLGPGVAVPYLQGTLVTLLLAYLARFFVVGYGPIESGLKRITPSIDEAAAGLGVRHLALLRRIHLPLMRSGIATAAILVFVDVMKEMPITLIARPFGWDTLAVRIFEMTSEGEWERAALPAVAIVIAGLIPILLLTRRSGHAS
ncbi:MAG TPA: iron ABC transporter permease [Steroidobacteraceae bacterium]|nr:iron ABC transporter permease [Steroidobacteraceae bacterium]